MHSLSPISTINMGYMNMFASHIKVFITNLRFDYKLMCIFRLYRCCVFFCVVLCVCVCECMIGFSILVEVT